jgi:multidrug efflux system outer membrane protein
MKANYKIIISILTVMVFIGSCKIGPNYKRPDFKPDNSFRFSINSDSLTFAMMEKDQLFVDPVLKDLIRKGFEKNFDLRVATEKINEARAQFVKARAQLFPELGAGVNEAYSQQPVAGQTITGNNLYGTLSLSWELDIWGKLRRSKEAARATLLQNEAYRRAVIITLVSDISTNYFDLIELRNELQITKNNIILSKQNLEMVKAKFIAGQASGLNVAQAESGLAAANADVPSLENQIALKENYLNFLVGEYPKDINGGTDMDNQLNVPDVLKNGVPSQLITYRPDIMQAEQTLVSANAMIGVARANMLPTLSISPNYGYSISAESIVFSLVGSLTAPIWGQGRLRASYKVSKSQKEQMLISYQKTIYNAIKEVADALVSVQKQKSVIEQQKISVAAMQKTYDLSNQLFIAGYTDYFQVIDAQKNLMQSQIQLSKAQNNQLHSYILLYKSLGGGLK